jgi:hypothetical protein
MAEEDLINKEAEEIIDDDLEFEDGEEDLEYLV